MNAPYGYCPECGAPGKQRQRSLNGTDECLNGHQYPSSKAIKRDQKSSVPAWDSVKDDFSKELAKTALKHMFFGVQEIPVLNCNACFERNAGELMCKGVPFAVTYYDSGNQRKFSLWSDGGVDVYEMARCFGGAGNSKEATFSVPLNKNRDFIWKNT